jgi:hypothetical protein
MPTPILNESGLLQSSGRFRDTFAPHAERVGNEFLRHQRLAGALHDSTARRGVSSHDQRKPHHALVNHDGDLGRCSARQHIKQRHDCREREEDV